MPLSGDTDPSFADSAASILERGQPPVAANPAAGQGLRLNDKGKAPVSVLEPGLTNGLWLRTSGGAAVWSALAVTDLPPSGTNDDILATTAGVPTWQKLVNANVAAAAAIAYSKLNLAASIVNADVNAAAAIDQTKLAFTAPQTYVPTWASTGTQPALGNGTITGRYIQIGKLVYFTVTLTMGTTTTFGTGIYTFTLPVTANSSSPQYDLGLGHGRDASAAADYISAAIPASTTTVALETFASPTGNWTNAVPVTWATSDTIVISGTYEAA